MHRRVAFLLFAAGWGANHFASMLLVYRRELALTASDLGILFAAYAVGLVPGLLLAGRASDARGRRALVIPASYLCVLGSAVLGFGSRGFAVLLAGRLLYGLGMGCVMSPGSVWVQELSSAELGPRRATLALSSGFGLGPLASGLLAELAPSPMIVPYVVHAVLLAVAIVLVRPVAETAPLDRAPSGTTRRGLGPREGRLLAQLLPAAPWTFGFASVGLVVLPSVFRAQLARPLIYAALASLVTLAAGVLVQPLTTRIGRRADLLGLSLGVVGILLGAASVAMAAPYLAFVAFVFLGSGYGLVITTGLREVAQKVPARERGTVVGIYYVLTYLGFGMPFLHATIARRVGDLKTLLGMAAAVVVCLGVRAVIEAKPRG